MNFKNPLIGASLGAGLGAGYGYLTDSSMLDKALMGGASGFGAGALYDAVKSREALSSAEQELQDAITGKETEQLHQNILKNQIESRELRGNQAIAEGLEQLQLPSGVDPQAGIKQEIRDAQKVLQVLKEKDGIDASTIGGMREGYGKGALRLKKYLEAYDTNTAKVNELQEKLMQPNLPSFKAQEGLIDKLKQLQNLNMADADVLRSLETTMPETQGALNRLRSLAPQDYSALMPILSAALGAGAGGYFGGSPEMAIAGGLAGAALPGAAYQNQGRVDMANRLRGALGR